MFEMDLNFDRVKHTYRYLVDEIERLSEGVFLWARLVVRSLSKGIGYRVTPEYLTKKLHTVPKELNELFDQMLGSVDPEDRVLSDKLFLIATIAQHPVLEQPLLKNAFLYLWLEDLDDPKFPLNRPMHAYSDSDIDERIQDVTCLVDRLSRGLLEVTHQQHQQDKYFAFEVRFTHRTAYDYIFNTWLPRMQKRTPKFDINLATVQLLLAQFKHARARPADVEPWPPVQLWKPTSLLHHFQSTFDWISAINKAGYAIPSQYLEEFGKFLEGYARCVRIPTKERRSPLQNVRWGSKMAAIYSLHMAWTARPLSYICWLLRYGLEQCLSPDALDRLECQYTNIAGGANLLLSAAIYKRVDFVRSLLGKGHTPNESVSVLLSDLRRTDPPMEYRTTTVWFIFL